MLHMSDKKYEEAIEAFKAIEAEEKFDKNGRSYALLLISSTHSRMRDFDKSWETLQEFFDKYPDSSSMKVAETLKGNLLKVFEKLGKAPPGPKDVGAGTGNIENPE